MTMTLVFVATGDRSYLEEALAGIRWHRSRGLTHPIDLWIDASTDPGPIDANVRELPAVATALPANVVAWYQKSALLKQYSQDSPGPFCLLDAYARILDVEKFDEAEELTRKFDMLAALDPRRIIAEDLKVGRGLSAEVIHEAQSLPETFPLWNTGVLFVAPSIRSQTLLARMEEKSRGYLEKSWAFREQITLAQAVHETGIAPLTLPDAYNVRRPFVRPAIVLHTRRFGHFYGVGEVDRPADRWERTRHRIKANLADWLRLRTLFPS